jgi:hypothetical protein
MPSFAHSTLSILSVVALYNGALLSALAAYLWAYRGRGHSR